MAEDIGLPLGKIVKSTTTQEQSLFSVLEECRRKAFNGYLTMYFYMFGSYYEGNIVFVKGEPMWASASFDQRYLGNEAFARMLEEAQSDTCNIDLHELAEPPDVLQRVKAGRIERGEGKEAATQWQLGELKHLRQRMETWRKVGWDVTPLEEVLATEKIDDIKQEFDAFERNVSTMKDLRERLYLLDANGFEAQKKRIEEMISDVRNTLAVRREILELENRIMERRKKDRRETSGMEVARYESLMHYWKSKGYFVDRLETALRTGNIDIIKTEFKLFERDIEVLDDHRRTLEEMRTKRYRRERERLMEMTYDPVNLPVLERDIYHLGLKVAAEDMEEAPPRRKGSGPAPPARASPATGTGGKKVPAGKTGVRRKSRKAPARTKAGRRGTPTRPAGGKAVRGAPRAKGTSRARPASRVKRLMRSMTEGAEEVPKEVILGERTSARERQMPVPEHFKRFTFETFVVDETNRFTRAAAFAVAQSPGKTYNPLFIYSPTGLGKTHLLGAIYNHIVSRHPDLRVVYVTSEDFANDVVESIRTARPDAIQKYETADVLLIDDIQILAGKESGQEVFFQIFNVLHSQGKQIVITSDRPPKDLKTLERRLRTRFEGGLIADIQPPSLELRTAILIKKGAEMGVLLQADVIEYIAGNITLSIRELEGALTKLHAEYMLTKRTIDLGTAKRLLRDYIEGKGSETAYPAIRTAPPKRPKQVSGTGPRGLIWGFSYLLEVVQPDPAYRLFTEGLKEASGLCISRTNPKHLAHFYDLSNARVLWLTDIPSSLDTVSSMLEELMEEMLDEINRHDRLIVMLDGIEYLVHTHGFDPVINFIRHLKDAISERRVILLVPLNPRALKGEDLATIEREMTVRRGD